MTFNYFFIVKHLFIIKMNNNKNSLQEFLQKQSLFQGKNVNITKSTFLTHQKYVDKDKNVNQVQVNTSKGLEQKSSISYYGKRSEKKKDAMKLN